MKKLLAALVALSVLLAGVTLAGASESGVAYRLGDTIEDFTFTACDGQTVALSDLLKEKDMVLLNLWATWCGPCAAEFPAIEEAYQRYKDQVAVVALSVEPNDTDAILSDYAAKHGMSFLVGHDDPDFNRKFRVSAIPTSVVIDRSGVICLISVGSVPDPDVFSSLFSLYVGADYEGPLLLNEMPVALPDVSREDPAVLAGALGTEAAVNPKAPHIWPMISAQASGRDVVTPANCGRKDRTAAELDIPLTAEDGSAIAVTAKLSTRPALDTLTLLVNGVPVKGFSGEMDWFTYALPAEHGGSVTLTLRYQRNSAEAYEDAVFIDRVQVLSGSEAAAALAENPVYPVSDAVTLEPFGENIRKISASSPVLMEGLLGNSAFYIVNGDTVTCRATITPDFDPDVDVFFDNSTGVITPVRDGVSGEGLTFTGRVGSVDTTGLPFSLLYLYWNDLNNDTSITLFRDETNADLFFSQFLPSYGVQGITWAYQDDPAPAQDPAADSADYVVRYIDQDGNPVPGVWCQVCDEKTCTVFTSDENGECRFTLAPNAWEIHTLRVPEGYEGDTKTVTIAPVNGGEMTFTLNRV